MCMLNIGTFLGNKKITFGSFLMFLFLAGSCQKSGDKYQTWKVYKGDSESTSYSKLDQINRDNVDRLNVAWIYNSGDTLGISASRCRLCNAVDL